MVKRQRGFTFIEMLLAAAIFAMVGMASVAVLSSVTQSDALSVEATERLVQLQRSMLMLERDFMQISVRHVRIDGEAPSKFRLYGEKFLLESEDHGVSFTRQGWRNPGMILPRSEIQTVAYRLQEGNLQRLFTLYPDAVTGTEPKVQMLLNGLTGFEIQYLKGEEWLERWQDSNFPKAVRITLTDEYLGRLERVFILPDGAVANTGGR
ncbi:type II secretion system minor pseudopilin GspJ [Rheinheimera baltica]|uniref:type II secretion system minor pseudopilin GspJ n=1 Tax=Rheinheimera baltica TaxID=67576 RepID=UPI00273F2D82|nr:type II secretion system minor pseudopilin GspJ [Rheinheimera baltica]MDP5143568.1 type II secretion system minor pseudopilin GspJ [Rheinheimera baltica]MDP5151077.1 type II secretion system minor pseudopilin GspJ [Rheinheimera baltica]